MNNKLLYICLTILVILMAVLFLKIRHDEKAARNNRAIGQSMLGLRQAPSENFDSVPADGMWHNCPVWPMAQNITCLRARRLAQRPEILEAQLKSSEMPGVYTVKVRIRG